MNGRCSRRQVAAAWGTSPVKKQLLWPRPGKPIEEESASAQAG